MPAGCGRRKVDPAWAGFFGAFGFFASRLLRLRSLLKIALLVVSPITLGAGDAAFFRRRRHMSSAKYQHEQHDQQEEADATAAIAVMGWDITPIAPEERKQDQYKNNDKKSL